MLPESITLSALDRQFSSFICRHAGTTGEPLRLAVALLCHAVASGHVCLDLREVAGLPLSLDGQMVTIPELAGWIAALRQSGVVGTGAGEMLPLVLTPVGRLYLWRYWQDEVTVSQYLAATVSLPSCNEVLLQEWLPRLFTGGPSPDWQRAAAETALRGRVTVISGGPGTGKTTTVARIMALLALAGGVRGEEIAIAAPTGKAAARLGEAIGRSMAQLPLPTVVTDHLPRTAVTLHRLLGRTNRQGEEKLLTARVVIVDEASMVALPLLARLVRALGPEARLILLGDRDQLASVEAGAVLGDLCALPTPEVALATSATACPLAKSVVLLRQTYRFDTSSGIGQASRLVCSGAGDEALTLFRSGDYPDIAWYDLPEPRQLDEVLTPLVLAGFGPYLAAADPLTALQCYDRFRLLATVRDGEYGVLGLNARIERLLARQGLINPRPVWYRGRPVLVTANDYGVRLANGDIGLTLPDPAHGGELRVFFVTPDGLRSIHPLRLPAHETAFALTVHKSQGSEFTTVALVLPPKDLPLLTRELVYTGLTRARESVHLIATADLFLTAVSRRVNRSSGLRDALWGN